MKVEYTGRQTPMNKKLKAQAEKGLAQIVTILGKAVSAHVILSEDKYLQVAEVSVVTRRGTLVATCKGAEMTTALHDALEKVEQQAIRHKQKTITQKRHPKGDKNEPNVAAGEAETPVIPVKRAVAKKIAAKESASRKAVSMVVHSFPSKMPLIEPHVVRSIDSAAMYPMTFEEAVKEAAFRDRDVFVFRDHAGQVMILHRKRDGKMELIEVPA